MLEIKEEIGKAGEMKSKIREERNKCNKIGEIGEQFIEKNFRELTIPILDNFLYSKRYIYDLEPKEQIEGKDGEIGLHFKYEVKTREKYYPDILLEIRHEYNDGHITWGWFDYSKSNIIYYLYKGYNDEIIDGYILILGKIKEFFTEDIRRQYPEKSTNKGNPDYTTFFITVPFEHFPPNSLLNIKDKIKTKKKKKIGIENWIYDD